MLRKLDRYILGKYSATYLFTALVFSLVATAVDLSEKLEKIIVNKLSAGEVFVDYYIHFLPYINGVLWPIFALISVIFFTSRMAYNSEIIAMFNAGISFARFMQPYLIGAVLFGGLHLVGNHWFIPEANKKRLEFEHQYIWPSNEKGKSSDVHLFLKPGEKIFINFYRKADSTMVDVRLEQYRGQQLTSVLKARSAQWMSESGKWKLRNYEIRQIDSLEEKLIDGAGKELDTLLNVSPDDFVEYVDQKDMMTTPELSRYIGKLRQRGSGNTRKYEVEMHRRTADPFTILILTLIGAALASRKVRGGLGLHLAMGMIIGAVYIFLSRFSTTFAMNQSLAPILGVWLPNLLFGGIALWLGSKAQQ